MTYPEDKTLLQTAHRPWPMPAARWRLRQRWTKLLFAHWPMPPEVVQQRLPPGLRVDTHDGWAWLGVAPFVMDRVRFRSVGEHSISVPGAQAFPELNLRTYCIAPDGRPGVYFFSLDAGSLLAVLGARVAFSLPYFWSNIRMWQEQDCVHYTSVRRVAKRVGGEPVSFDGSYRPLGIPAQNDGLSHFVTHRYAFFLRRFGHIAAGEIHHAPWALEQAEAEFRRNDLPASFGFSLPDRPPVLHYAPEVHMEAWTLARVRQP